MDELDLKERHSRMLTRKYAVSTSREIWKHEASFIIMLNKYSLAAGITFASLHKNKINTIRLYQLQSASQNG